MLNQTTQSTSTAEAGRHLRTLGPLAALIATLGPAPLAGQELDYTAYEALFDEPVTASVTGSPQRSSDVPASMEIITSEEIRRSGARDIPGVLSHVNGVNVREWTASGADVSVRGYNRAFSSRLLVLINGRQVYADHYGYTPWSTLPVELGEIRQIEVVKGPNSALFGFNAVGGVVNIVTHNPVHDDTDFVHVRAGTQDTAAAGAAATFSPTDYASIRVSGGARSNDDYSTPLLPADTGTRRGDERTAIRLDTHIELTPSTGLEFEASRSVAEQTNMGPTYTLAFEETEVRSLKAVLRSDTRVGLVRASVYRNWIDNKVFANTTFDGVDFVASDTPVAVFDNAVTVAKARNIFKIGTSHTFRVSGELRESSLATTPYSGATVAYDIAAAGFMWQWQVLPSVTLTNAVRQDRLSLERRGVMPEGLGLTNADWDRTIDETSFNSGLVWDVDEANTLRFVVARGAQLPSLFHLGGNLVEYSVPPEFQPPATTYTTGLPTLEPTVVDNFEIRWDRALPAIDGSFDIALFAGETQHVVSDFGAFQPDRNIYGGPANIGDSETEGLEVSAEGAFADRGDWRLGYTRQRVDDGFDPVAYPAWFTYRDFENTTPEHVVAGKLGWSATRWRADVFVRYESDREGLRVPAVDEAVPPGEIVPPEEFVPPEVLRELPSYVSVDASFAYEIRDDMTLSVSARNLLNDTQRQTSGPEVERVAEATLEVRF